MTYFVLDSVTVLADAKYSANPTLIFKWFDYIANFLSLKY